MCVDACSLELNVSSVDNLLQHRRKKNQSQNRGLLAPTVQHVWHPNQNNPSFQIVKIPHLSRKNPSLLIVSNPSPKPKKQLIIPNYQQSFTKTEVTHSFNPQFLTVHKSFTKTNSTHRSTPHSTHSFNPNLHMKQRTKTVM